MFYYFSRINRKINDTLNIYQDIGKLGLPFFKYVLIFISFLIAISSMALMFSFFVDNSVSMDANSIWINYSLPIIIYGVICPLLSTLISLIFKMFLEFNIDNIINKYKYLRKKEGKPPNIVFEFLNIAKFIVNDKYSKLSLLSIPLSVLMIVFFNTIISVIVLVTIIIFCITLKLIEYYDNSIDCYISGIEKCYTDEDCYWRYNINIKYPHEEKRIVKKRFNDFKKLHTDLDMIDSLPTSYWIKPLQLKEAEERGVQLNVYLKHLFTNKNMLGNSIIYSFFKDNQTNQSNIEIDDSLLVIERKPIEEELDDMDIIDYNNILKNQLNSIINEPIKDIYILYEINYYTALKKRFFVLCDENLYKLKYNKFLNEFSIRDHIHINNIYRIEESKITNTCYFKGHKILNIKFIQNNTINQFILTSLSNDTFHNIHGLHRSLKKKLPPYKVYESDGFIYDNGYGISETIHNNGITKNFKKMLTQNMLYSKRYLRYIWK